MSDAVSVPGRALEIRYRRTGADRGDYVHKFSRRSGVRMRAHPDGSIVLKGRRRIWADDRKPGFSRYLGRSNPMKRRGSSSNSMLWLALGGLAIYLFTRPSADRPSPGPMYTTPVGPFAPVPPFDEIQRPF